MGSTKFRDRWLVDGISGFFSATFWRLGSERIFSGVSSIVTGPWVRFFVFGFEDGSVFFWNNLAKPDFSAGSVFFDLEILSCSGFFFTGFDF